MPGIIRNDSKNQCVEYISFVCTKARLAQKGSAPVQNQQYISERCADRCREAPWHAGHPRFYLLWMGLTTIFTPCESPNES